MKVTKYSTFYHQIAYLHGGNVVQTPCGIWDKH